MKHKVKYVSFEKSIKAWQLWISVLAYHVASLFVFRLLPQKTIEEAHKIVFEKPSSVEKAAIVNLARAGVNNEVFLDAAMLINVFFYDLIFVVIFMIIKRYKTKRYNIFAVFTAVITVNLLFYFYFRSLALNLF